jgi:S1-C subfamily serine protease
MKNAISFLLLVSLAFLASTVSGCVSKSERAFKRNSVTAVAIRGHIPGVADTSYGGTGVFLGTDGLVLTARHVAQAGATTMSIVPELKVCVVIKSQVVLCKLAEIVAISPDDDVALLRADLPDLAPTVIRPDAEPLREAEEVYARLGYGTLLLPSLAYGRYLGTDSDGDDLYDLAAMPGSSGGPIYDLQGRLVGLAVSVTVNPGRSLTASVSSRDILKFLFANEELLKRK